jgi:hypothetical protein
MGGGLIFGGRGLYSEVYGIELILYNFSLLKVYFQVHDSTDAPQNS